MPSLQVGLLIDSQQAEVYSTIHLRVAKMYSIRRIQHFLGCKLGRHGGIHQDIELICRCLACVLLETLVGFMLSDDDNKKLGISCLVWLMVVALVYLIIS
jgi:hypothetical protein